MNSKLQQQINDLYFSEFDADDYAYFKEIFNQHKGILPDVADKPLLVLQGDRNFYNNTVGQFVEGSLDGMHSAFGVQKGDSLFVTVHGADNFPGHIALGGRAYKPQALIDFLETKHLIPEGTKNIYTMSCYGGLQQPFITESGIHVESGHTSTKPILNFGFATDVNIPHAPDFGMLAYGISEGQTLSDNAMASLISNARSSNDVVFSYYDFYDILAGEKTYEDLPYFAPKNEVPKTVKSLDVPLSSSTLGSVGGLIPPNWANDGSDIYLNRRYDEIIRETFGEYIDDFSKPMSVLWMPDKESGYKIAENMFDNQDDFGLNLVRNYDSLIFEIHGTSRGLVAYQGGEFEPSTLIQRLEDTGIIPEDINRIYTSSCYGGLQNRGVTKRGIPFESIHTSPVPTWGKGNTSSLDEIGESLQDIRLSILANQEEIAIFLREEDKLKQIRAEREELLKKIELEKNKPRLVTNRLDEGVITDKYKKEVIGNYNKYGSRFADASFVATEEEIEHALWYLAKPSVEKEVKYYDGLIENYHGYLESAEGHLEFWRIQEVRKGVSYSEHINETLEHIADLKSTIAEYEGERQGYLDTIEANKPYDREDWHVSEERPKQPQIEYNFKKDNFGQYYFSDEMPAYKTEEKIPESNGNYNVNGQYSFLENDGSIKEEYIVKPKLTAQEAFDKYGPNSDEFYTSQGLDPVQQREAIEKLNSGRKPVDNTPVETRQFQQQLDSLGITEEEYYRRFNEEMMSKPRKQYTPVRGPKLKQKSNYTPETSAPKPDVSIPKPNKTPEPIPRQPNWTWNSPDTSTPHLDYTRPKPNKNITSKSIPKQQMQIKSLNGGGMGSLVGGVVVGVAGLAVAKMVTDEHKEKKKTNRQRQNKDVQSQQIDNSYAMQMAQDISSYRYGKHMTGFVNY